VKVRSPQAGALGALLEARGAAVAVAVDGQGEGTLRVTGATSDLIGELARANGLTLLELSTHQASLEDRYMELTRGSADYRTTQEPLAPVRK